MSDVSTKGARSLFKKHRIGEFIMRSLHCHVLSAALHPHPEGNNIKYSIHAVFTGLGWVSLPSAASGYTAHSHGTGPTADLPEQHLQKKKKNHFIIYIA